MRLLSLFLFTILLLSFQNEKALAQTNLALTATATHSGGGGIPNYGPALCNDNIIPPYPSTTVGTFCWVNTGGWIEYTWTNPVSIDSITFHNGYSAARSFTSLVVQYWDGSAYVNAGTVTGTATATVSYQLPTTINTTRLRFFNMAGTNPALTEIQVWEKVYGFNDGGIVSLVSPNYPFCPGNHDLSVKVKNYGLNAINTLTLNWTLNGILQPSIPITTALDTIGGLGINTLDVVLQSNLNITNSTTIKAWTSAPNGGVDTINSNDTIMAILNPVSFNISPAADTICGNSSSLITLSPSSGYGTNVTISWEESSDNGSSWNTIVSANNNTYEVSNITSSRQYRAKINNNGSICYSNISTILLDSMSIISSIGDTLCGSGILTLSATPSSGLVNWYDVATGGTVLHTGTSFTTPNISTTTTYYAEASTSSGGLVNVGPLNPSSLGAGGYTNLYSYKTFFTVNTSTTLTSVDIFPQSATGAGVIEILTEPGLSLVSSTPFTVTTGGNLVTGQTVVLNTTLPPGNYSVKFGSSTTGSYYRNTAGANFPYTSSVANLTGQSFNGYPQYYYYTYNFAFGSAGCASPRVPVLATINPLPNVDLGNVAYLCPGSQTILSPLTTVPGETYLWNTNATTSSITVSTPGIYSLSVNNGICTASDTITVNAAPNPIAPLQDTISICDGDEITLNAGNTGATYDWSTGSINQTIDVSNAGEYSVTITNSFNCSISDTSYLILNPLPIVDIGMDTIVCSGAQVTLDAGNPGASYLWSTGENTQTINVNQGGSYSVIVTNGFNCFADDEILIDIYTPASVDGFSFVPRFDIQAGLVEFYPINPNLVDSFHWDFGDGNTSSLAEPSNLYSNSGEYIVTLSIFNECGSADTSLIINVDLYTNSITKVEKDKLNISVYPVPASDILNIEAMDNGVNIKSIKLFNALGQELKVSTDGNQNKRNININALAAGNYFIKIETNKGNAMRKFNIIK